VSGMSPKPRVTIGVTTYRNGRYLRSAFDDILARNRGEFEVAREHNELRERTLAAARPTGAHFRQERLRVFGDTRCAWGRSGLLLGDQIATIDRFVAMWAASHVRIRLGLAWRRHIGAGCAESTRTAVG
jgi:hypothetical protein